MDRLTTIYNADKLLLNGETFIFDACYIHETHDQFIEKFELIDGKYTVQCDEDNYITVMLENYNETHKLSEDSYYIPIETGAYCIMTNEKRALLISNNNIHNK